MPSGLHHHAGVAQDGIRFAEVRMRVVLIPDLHLDGELDAHEPQRRLAAALGHGPSAALDGSQAHLALHRGLRGDVGRGVPHPEDPTAEDDDGDEDAAINDLVEQHEYSTPEVMGNAGVHALVDHKKEGCTHVGTHMGTVPMCSTSVHREGDTLRCRPLYPQYQRTT